jgi:uncharacterized damage-inducible protein DinB
MMNSTPVGKIDREWPETFATDELRLKWEFLTFLRITAVNKIAGLTPEQAAGAPLASSPLTTLTGIVKHLTAVERYWISIIGGGVDLPNLWAGPDPEIDFRVTETDTPTTVVENYRAEWKLSERAIKGMSVSDKARGQRSDRKDVTIRWILTHLIQETARHVGHMDILREMADGERGE